MKYNLDKEKIENAILNSFTIAQTLEKLNIPKSGRNYDWFNKYIKKNLIDISHFTGQSWSKDRISLHGKKIDDYLSNKVKVNSNVLKKYLIKLNMKENKCECCNNDKWLCKNIQLELHHVDGNKLNNNLTNLQILCPNCHSFTDNYRKKKNNGDVV